MVKNLVIVESPAKAKTIEGYLGQDFVVRSSYGHVRDLPKDNNAVDIANGFKPTYVVDADKRELISQLKKLAKEAETVWLASDDDREGEAISWHLSETLNLKQDKTKRILDRMRDCAPEHLRPLDHKTPSSDNGLPHIWPPGSGTHSKGISHATVASL